MVGWKFFIADKIPIASFNIEPLDNLCNYSVLEVVDFGNITCKCNIFSMYIF